MAAQLIQIVVERKLALRVCLDRRSHGIDPEMPPGVLHTDNFERHEMKSNCDVNRRRAGNAARIFLSLALILAFFAPSAGAQTQPSDSRPAEPKPGPETYQTFYPANITQQRDANDLVTDLRNLVPRAKIYYMASQGAISIRATPDDILLAQKILADLDRPKKVYRLTYTLTEMDNGKRTATQHFSIIVTAGERTNLKQGRRVPIVTGSTDAGASAKNSQVQYVDVGLSIEASVEGYLDGVRLRTKVEQSSLAEEKAGVGVHDPVIHQSSLEETSSLVEGKPLMLGSLDIPGSTRKQEIEVVSELVR